MGLNDTPSAERIHIGFFGRRNAGKSSIVNQVTGQEMSVVSDVKGTTTDPVYKSMELLPLGPVVIIDTPGFDDEGSLGELRIRRTRQILNRSDCAVLVVDQADGITPADRELIRLFQEKALPWLLVYNKCDQRRPEAAPVPPKEPGIEVSALTGSGIFQLKEALGALARTGQKSRPLVSDLVHPGDFVILVIPIDGSAPKGRLILPQQQTIRELLEAGAVSISVKETELEETLRRMLAAGLTPALVITDSQAFAAVSEIVPDQIPLTSFSILMARYKGFLETAVRGAAAIQDLQDGDRILISEGCTHHRQCQDIGTVKLPAWLRDATGKQLIIETSSGKEFPQDLSPYRMVIHCGGCMLNGREMDFRQKCAADAHIPFLNYGIAIAYMKGILERSIQLFPDLYALLPRRS